MVSVVYDCLLPDKPIKSTKNNGEEMLELYHAEYSTCSQRVRMCLFEKGLDWRSCPVALEKGEQLTEEYLRMNPNGVVPTLVHDGKAVTESSVIIEYLDDAFPEPSLAPRNIWERARLRAWMRYFDEVPTSFIRYPSHAVTRVAGLTGVNRKELEEASEKRPVRKFIWRKMGPDGFSDADLTASFDALRQTVERIDGAIATSGRWIIGEDFSLADIMVMPSMDRMEDLGMSAIWADLPHCADWWERVRARPAYAKTYPAGARLSSRIEHLSGVAEEFFAEVLTRTGRASLASAT